MGQGFAISENDRRILTRALDRLRKEPANLHGRAEWQDLGREAQSSDVYVCKTPAAGIAGLTVGLGTGTGTSDDHPRPGHEDCDIWELVIPASGAPELFLASAVPYRVHNLSPNRVPGGIWVLIARDRFGSWYVTDWVSDADIGTGTFDIDDASHTQRGVINLRDDASVQVFGRGTKQVDEFIIDPNGHPVVGFGGIVAVQRMKSPESVFVMKVAPDGVSVESHLDSATAPTWISNVIITASGIRYTTVGLTAGSGLTEVLDPNTGVHAIYGSASSRYSCRGSDGIDAAVIPVVDGYIKVVGGIVVDYWRTPGDCPSCTSTVGTGSFTLNSAGGLEFGGHAAWGTGTEAGAADPGCCDLRGKCFEFYATGMKSLLGFDPYGCSMFDASDVFILNNYSGGFLLSQVMDWPGPGAGAGQNLQAKLYCIYSGLYGLDIFFHTWNYLSGTVEASYVSTSFSCDTGGVFTRTSGNTNRYYCKDWPETIQVNACTLGTGTSTGAGGSISGTLAATQAGDTVVATGTVANQSSAKFPGTVTSTLWTNPDNMKADDGNTATFDMTFPPDSGNVDLTNFGFAIGATTVDGIVVEVECRETAAAIKLDNVNLFWGGATHGDNKGTATELSTSLTVYTFGGASDTWNSGVLAADVNDAGFGCRIKFTRISGTPTVHVDYVKITVYYH